jgi:hypothetical protein
MATSVRCVRGGQARLPALAEAAALAMDVDRISKSRLCAAGIYAPCRGACQGAQSASRRGRVPARPPVERTRTGRSTGAGSTLPLNGIAAGTTNIQSFAETAFQLRITPTILPQGLGAAVLGALGGIAPAWRAARQPAALSLRA